jgi:hypothetical protein
MQAALKAQINKTDRNDARGIAQMMRAGLYRPVHVKTLRSQNCVCFDSPRDEDRQAPRAEKGDCGLARVDWP